MKQCIKIVLIQVVVIVGILSGGCSSIVSGTKQQLTFNSEPDGATVSINGVTMGKTPATVMVDRQKGQSVTFEKDGYKKQTIPLSTSLNTWFWGNIVIGGFLGSTTDAASGSMHEYVPNQFYVTLAIDSNSPIKEYGSEKAKLKEFIVGSYHNLTEDLSKGQGDYLSSLLAMLKIAPENKEEAIQKIHALSTVYSVIPEFAEQVANFYIK
ncbi:MAG: PEGA domain-containing protein [SAR324 cluster bacterium]|nr:PEGA domain-containing protein [SAR324 cluster bacterium]